MAKVNKIVKKKVQIKKKANNTCKYCNCSNPLIMTIDHRIPKSRGGSDDDANKDCVCWFCNQLKGSLTDKEFRVYLKSLVGLHTLFRIKIELQPLKVRFNDFKVPDFPADATKKIDKKTTPYKLPFNKLPDGSLKDVWTEDYKK